MTTFRDFYSFQKFEDYLQRDAAYDQGREEKGPAHDARVQSWIEGLKEFESALFEFLKAKAAAGEIQPVPFIDGRNLRWGNAWNRLVAGNLNEPYDISIVRGMGRMGMSYIMLGSREAAQREPSKFYEELIGHVDDGEAIEPSSSHEDCNRTGQTLYVHMGKGWAPQYGTLDDRLQFTALTENPPARQVLHDTISVPSGKLLIADWFRIEGFTKTVDATKLDDSINSEAGRTALSAYYAQTFNFASVHVEGYPSPELIAREGYFAVVRRSYDEETDDDVEVAGEVVGRISTDYRWVTVIDQQVLTDIVARTVGSEAAQDLVVKMLHAQDVMEMEVPQGAQLHIYHLHNGGLQDEFKCEAVDDKDLERLFMVMSLRPLEWVPAQAAAKTKAAP